MVLQKFSPSREPRSTAGDRRGSLPYTDDAYAAETFTPQGVGLRPFSVGHVEQPRRRGRTPGNLTIRWTRRDRALVSDSWDLDEVPMSEGSESYAVDILDGAAVKRTLTSTSTSVVYTSPSRPPIGARCWPPETRSRSASRRCRPPAGAAPPAPLP